MLPLRTLMTNCSHCLRRNCVSHFATYCIFWANFRFVESLTGFPTKPDKNLVSFATSLVPFHKKCYWTTDAMYVFHFPAVSFLNQQPSTYFVLLHGISNSSMTKAISCTSFILTDPRTLSIRGQGRYRIISPSTALQQTTI